MASQIGYVPYTLTNSQSGATAASMPQLMQSIDISAIRDYIAGDLSNLYWSTDTAGSTKLTTWRESGSGPDDSPTWWLNLGSNTIAASGGTLTVYLQVWNGTEVDGTTTGVAPQLTSTYAASDNGSSVFSKYQNFSGSTTPTGYTTSGTVTQNNGITMSSTGTNYIYYATTQNPQSLIMEVYGHQTGASEYDCKFEWDSTPAGNPAYMITNDSSDYDLATWSGGTPGSTSMAVAPGTANHVFSIWATSTSAYGTIDYGSAYSENVNFTAETAMYMSMIQANAGTVFVQLNRSRIPPPSYVMPSVTAGSPTGFPTIRTSTDVMEVLD